MKITVFWDVMQYIPVEILRTSLNNLHRITNPDTPEGVTPKKTINSKSTNPNRYSSMWGQHEGSNRISQTVRKVNKIS
jgi:hypothetical protein